MEIAITIFVLATTLGIGIAWGQSRMRKHYRGKLYKCEYDTRLKGLNERRTELQQILSDSNNGRTVDSVAKRLNDVTNTILETER